MKIICDFCKNEYYQKSNLTKHLKDSKCKMFNINNLVNILNEKNKIIEELKQQIVNINGNNNITNINSNNMKIEIHINPITKLDLNYIDTDKLKDLIEKFDDGKELINSMDKFNYSQLNLLLSNYIKNMIYNSEHPENHSVKYIKKKPPTYNSIIEDNDGNTVSVIKGLKDTCELLTDPILDQLKIKLKEFIKKYKDDTEPEFDYMLYENAIKELKKELNKQNVKKALSSVLKNDILNDIEMKLYLI